MAKVLFGMLLVGLIALPGMAPSADAQSPSEQKVPSELLKEGTQQILKAFELFLQVIPQYDAPEVLDNGDIIIRRKHPGQTPQDLKKTPGNKPPEKTRT
jgi:hypothetical protein